MARVIGYISRAVYQGACCRCCRVVQFVKGCDYVEVTPWDPQQARARCQCGRFINLTLVPHLLPHSEEVIPYAPQ